jgi:hypothetical protein
LRGESPDVETTYSVVSRRVGGVLCGVGSHVLIAIPLSRCSRVRVDKLLHTVDGKVELNDIG